MAKFRRNHIQGRGGFQIAWRFIVLLALMVIGLLWFAPRLSDLLGLEEDNDSGSDAIYSLRTYLPSSQGEVIHHRYYTLSYLEAHEQPEWTAHVLKEDRVKNKNHYRNKLYFEDSKVSTKSAKYYDYRGSGYERGHLVPAADMRFDSMAMVETFYMSNMSPMLRPFNNGIWRELEIQVRNWTYSTDSLYVISGPVLDQVVGRFGQTTKISVPSAFFKIILDYHYERPRAIAFIIPNALSDTHLREYIVPISEVEKKTGIKFFSEMLTEEERQLLIYQVDSESWTFSEKHYQWRVQEWNRE